LEIMSHPQLRVLGVDPGLTRCGIGVVEGAVGKPLNLVGVGVILTPVDAPHERRLLQLEAELEEWIALHKPNVIAVERVFSQHNVRTVMGTGQAAGIALLVAARRDIQVVMHTPSEVKAAVTGSGRANKVQVAEMVKRLLNLESIPKPVDSTDALALAICNIWRGAGNSRIEDALKKEKSRIAKLVKK
jgi:crossover junction endodeoxyribonuclease RuvC